MTTQAPEVEVGPFWVTDSSRAELVARMVDLSLPDRRQPALAFALHVGGLNARREHDFVVAMRQADVVYADGGSVVWLARLAGAPTWSVRLRRTSAGRSFAVLRRGPAGCPGWRSSGVLPAWRHGQARFSKPPGSPRSSLSTTASTMTGASHWRDFEPLTRT